MQIDTRLHFQAIILPAIAAYGAAEVNLTKVIVEKQTQNETTAGFTALREGGAAALYLHHFSDIVAKRPVNGLPDFNGKVKAVREWLGSNCLASRGTNDVELLGDVADALKHAVLTQHLPREVEEAGQVLAVGRGYGTGGYGEGKYGGVNEVWILGRSGIRPLTSVLNSVSDLWQHNLGI